MVKASETWCGNSGVAVYTSGNVHVNSGATRSGGSPGPRCTAELLYSIAAGSILFLSYVIFIAKFYINSRYCLFFWVSFEPADSETSSAGDESGGGVFRLSTSSPILKIDEDSAASSGPKRAAKHATLLMKPTF